MSRSQAMAVAVAAAVIGALSGGAAAQSNCTNTSVGAGGTQFNCGPTSNCCPITVPVCEGTTCVASCVYPRVRDVRHGFDDQCISLAQGCGDNCTECSQSGACLRCQSVPLYRLEGSRCVENCSSGQVSSMQFLPVVNVICTPAPPPTAGSAAPTFSNAPSVAPTAIPTTIPSAVPTGIPTTGRPTTASPTRQPLTRFPTGSRIRTGTTSTASESSNPFDDPATIIVVAICAGSVVLLAAFAACYIGRDYCRDRDRYSGAQPAPGRIEVNEVTNATFFIDGGGPGRSRDGGYLETDVDTEDAAVGAGVGVGVAAALGGAQDEEATLSGPEATEFFEWLAVLKKDRDSFRALHKQTKALQQAQTTAAERLRFAKNLNNFQRLADLFAQKKGHVSAPADGMALLDWAQKTLDRFNEQQ